MSRLPHVTGLHYDSIRSCRLERIAALERRKKDAERHGRIAGLREALQILDGPTDFDLSRYGQVLHRIAELKKVHAIAAAEEDGDD